MATPQPGIGDWYRLDSGSLFEVVAFDADDGTIEIQYFDGTVEEMDVEDWDDAVGTTGRWSPPRPPRTGAARSTSRCPMSEGRGAAGLRAMTAQPQASGSIEGIDLFE